MTNDNLGFTPPQNSAPQAPSSAPISPTSSGQPMGDVSSSQNPMGSSFGKSPFGSRNVIIAIVLIVLILGGGIAYWYKEKQERELEEFFQMMDDYNYDDYSYDDYTSDDYSYDYSRDTYYTEAASTPGYQHYVDTAYYFEMDYPEDWTVEAEDGVLVASFVSPYKDDYDYFSENLNVTTEDVSWYGPMTLQEYADASVEQIKLALPEYEVVEIRDEMMGQNPAMSIYGSYVVDDFDSQIWSTFTLIDGTAYVITFTCDSVTCSDYESIREHVTRSFELY